MKEQLFINGEDAFVKWGVAMGEGFLESLYAPVPLKSFVENKSWLMDGKEVLYSTPHVDEREFNLTFYIKGENRTDYLSRLKAFKKELAKGRIEIRVPVSGEEVYKLTYLNSTGFALDVNQHFSKLTVKFNEPNPADRS